MPLKWEDGLNPYRHSYFARLRLGPHATPTQMIAQAKQLAQKVAAGEKILIGDRELDEHALNEAQAKLREPATLAQELLLTHPQPKVEGKKLKKLCEEVRQIAVPAAMNGLPPLKHPLAVFWFLPVPEPESVELPPWEALGLGEPGDEHDAAWDIVLDY